MNALLIFLKEPIAGKVKTRLAASVGEEEAALRYKAMVAVLLEQLEGLTNTHVRFCYAPDDAEEAISFWLLPQLRGDVIKRGEKDYLFTPSKNAPAFSIDFKPQGNGDLGDRLERSMTAAHREGYEKVAVMGTDCIHCGARWINMAFLQTKENICTIGPSGDGGYYLLATSSDCPDVFQNIPWSSTETLASTINAAKNSSMDVRLLPELLDIDDEESWNTAIDSAIGGKLKATLEKLKKSAC